jgi:hypothetical protein
MPPPELLERAAPASVGALVLAQPRAEVPMPRHTGPRATEAHLRGRLLERQKAGDLTAERDAAILLARHLASRGRDLRGAIALAQRAVAIEEDAALRVELAGWLAGLGEAAEAASVLRGLVANDKPFESGRTLLKIAVLHARAGDAAAAATALDEAAALDPADAMAVELFGTLSSWAPAAVPPEGAAAAYLEAARRHAEANEVAAAYEDRLRAFEVAPQHAGAAEAVAEALGARGLGGAADEVLRLHLAAANAGATEGEPSATVAHRRRMLAALKDGDAARALGALLDASLEGVIEGDEAGRVDEALSLAGFYELLAVRLEARAERASGAARAEAYQALAKLWAGPLGAPEPAIEAWIEAYAADPTSTAAQTALRDHALATHDPAPLIEALVRIGLGATHAPAVRVSALRDLVHVADERAHDPALAAWAVETLGSVGGDGDRTSVERLGVSSRRERSQDDLSAAQRAYDPDASREVRTEALRRLLVAYQSRPSDPSAWARAAADLARLAPADRGALVALDRAARRSGDEALLESVLGERVAASVQLGKAEAAPLDSGRRSTPDAAPARIEEARLHLALSAIARRRGDEPRALEEAMRALEEAPGLRAAASAVLFYATRVGRTRERADALIHLASPAWPVVRSVVLAVAAELYHLSGATDASRRTAEQACEADPGCARAVATLSAVTEATLDRIAAAAVERAMTTVLPRGVWCGRLARAFDRLEEAGLALAWTQRWLALHPGNAEAMVELLRRATATRDASNVADALGWVLAQPRPLAEFVDAITISLASLLELDKARAKALARRALDVLGPSSARLRARLLDFAERASDPGLGIAVLERHLATEAAAPLRAEVLLDLTRRRTDAGDFDGAALELARASHEASDPAAVLAQTAQLESRMRDAGAWLGSDGLTAIAEARAFALEASSADPGAAATAFRELGSLRWDLGEDTGRAEDAFYRACELHPASGVERYARDMCAFAGVQAAVEALSDRAHAPAPSSGSASVAHAKHGADLLVAAANLASEHAMHDRALRAAVAAIELDPARADAVPLVERSAHVEGGVAALDHAYDRLAAAALGCFGRRAAHYRAARQLEKRGAILAALRHAAACFEAVPSEGTSFVLLTRLAERAGDPTEAVRALEHVAEASSVAARPAWLKRAASIAGAGANGARVRFELLLRALNARPDPATVAEVASAARELTHGAADNGSEMVRPRCERAIQAALKRIDGPDGARAAIAMAELGVELGATDLAFSALDHAMAADGDVDEFSRIEPLFPRLLENGEAARAWVARVRETAEKPYSSVGRALLCLASRAAAAVGDKEARASLIVAAVRRAAEASGQRTVGPEEDALVQEADFAVREQGDPELAKKLDAVAMPAERALAQLRLAEEREREGLDAEAITLLERALGSRALDGDVRAKATARLQRILGRAGRSDEAEVLLRGELARESLAPPAQGRIAHDLADLLLDRDRKEEAFEVLAALAADQGRPDPDLLAEMRGLARATQMLARYAEVLAEAVPRAESDAQRLEIYRELAPIQAEIGDAEKAALAYAEIARLDPGDAGALEVLERAANDRGDHAEIARLLARRISLTPAGDKRRMLRLRRAAVLEQRLGFLDEAAAELDALLVDAPDDPSALRFLADIHERHGAPLDAAALLVRLEALRATPEERAEYALRAAAAYLAGTELDLAERALERAAAMGSNDRQVELRVELARARGDTPALAAALEQLAASSNEPPERRASFLLDAARAAAASGDDATAIDRARRALKLAPMLAEAVLEARRLEYRAGGAGTPREAQAAVDDLTRIESRLPASMIELQAFLLAEELDVIQGGGAGMRELSRRHAELGPRPLIALGMAERLVRAKNFAGALPLYDHALHGDLRGMRTRGRVALAAAEAAQSTHAFTLATQLLDMAAEEPETRAIAQRKQLELAAMIGDPVIARQALEQLLATASGLDRARVLLQLARIVGETDAAEATRLLGEALPLASSDRSLPGQIEEVRTHLERRRAPRLELLESTPPPPPSSPPPSETHVAPESETAGADHARLLAILAPTPHAPGEAKPPPSVRAAFPRLPSLPPPLPVPRMPAIRAVVERGPDVPVVTSDERAAPLVGEAAPPSAEAPTGARPTEVARPPEVQDPGDEQALLRELAKGDFDAGEKLVGLYAGRAPASDVLAVRRQQALLRLGDRGALNRLFEAAVLDGNAAYARAIEHVLSVWDPAAPAVPAPSLATQRLAPDLVTSLLFRPFADSAVHEALALVLDTGLYRRDVGQYQLTGVARVQPTGGSVLGETFALATRMLGQARTALFHRRGAGASGQHQLAAPASSPTFVIALLSPPAIVMTGDVREETPDLRYQLGAALAGAMPEHALVNALGEEGLGVLVDALHAAFGPVANLPRGNAEVARLGQNLWQLVAPRADRRLRELCENLSQVTTEAAVRGTRQAMARAALFASGDLGVTFGHLAIERGISLAAYEGAPDGLSRAAADHADVADLLRLAIRTEFAEARWSSAPIDRRRVDTGPRSQRWDGR